jgi:HEPN domain-containing protein
MTREWVEKAEADYDVVLLLRKSRNRRRYDTIRFHCQQCVEKYLEAVVQEEGERVPRTHDLTELLKLVLPLEPTWFRLHGELEELTKAAVLSRYPGPMADSDQARRAYKVCTEVRSLVRARLGMRA